jgi:glycerophosphoryl diester phosphodiesterase
VYNTAYKNVEEAEKQFDFKTFPQLKECLDELERDFASSPGCKSVAKTDDASGMIDMCQKKLKSAKKIGCPVQ